MGTMRAILLASLARLGELETRPLPMNSQEVHAQLEALEARLAAELKTREELELEFEVLSARHEQAELEIQAFKTDIWSIEEVQQALEAVGRTGSEFVLQMDQVLRTSLDELLGAIELLQSRGLSKAQENLAKGAAAAGFELMGMLNATVNYCRIDAGHLALNSRAVSTQTLLSDLCAPYEARARAKGLTLESLVSESAPTEFEVDPELLSRALGHLLENALAHTSSGGITVRLDFESQAKHGELACSVVDTGQGIDAGELSRIFGAFERGESNEHEGIGLGLTIVRRLAQLLNGRFELTSERGVGSSATLFLPYAAVGVTPQPPVEEPAPEKRSTRARLLVVEDNDVNQKVAVGFLKLIGCDADTASNGLQAIERLSSTHCDLVLMDCMMPEMDGFAATKCIREGEAGEQNATIPIIALTADDSPSARQNCLRAGMDDYTTKPVRIDRLRSMLRIWLPPALRPSAE